MKSLWAGSAVASVVWACVAAGPAAAQDPVDDLYDRLISDQVLSAEETLTVLTGEVPVAGRVPTVVFFQRVLPHHSMDAQAVWRRAEREDLEWEDALDQHLAEYYRAGDRSALEARLRPELTRLSRTFELFSVVESAEVDTEEGRLFLRSRYRRYLDDRRALDFLSLYDRGVEEYRSAGHTEHYAVVRAVTDASARMMEFTSDGLDSYPAGSNRYNELLWTFDEELRRGSLLQGLSPNERRQHQRAWQGSLGEYGVSYRPHRVQALRAILRGDSTAVVVGEQIFLTARALRKAIDSLGRIADFERLASLHWHGLGVRKDREAAEGLFKEAIALGSVEAIDELATLYYTEFDEFQAGARLRSLERVAELYGEAAEQGLPRAMLNLGGMYYNGAGVEQDFDQAASWFDRAAEAAPDSAFAQVCRAWSGRARQAQQDAADRKALAFLEEHPVLAAAVGLATDPEVLSVVVPVFAWALSQPSEPLACEGMLHVKYCTYTPGATYRELSCANAFGQAPCGYSEGWCDTAQGHVYNSYRAAEMAICPAEDARDSPEGPDLADGRWPAGDEPDRAAPSAGRPRIAAR